MNHQIIERQRTWTLFVAVNKMRTLCRLADALEPVCGENISEIQYNLPSRHGVIIIRKDPSLSAQSLREAISGLLPPLLISEKEEEQ